MIHIRTAALALCPVACVLSARLSKSELQFSAASHSLLQPPLQEFSGDNGNAVGIGAAHTLDSPGSGNDGFVTRGGKQLQHPVHVAASKPRGECEPEKTSKHPMATLNPSRATGIRQRNVVRPSFVGALTTGLLFIQIAFAVAQSRPSEYDAKAAYLFNFGKFMHLSGAQPPVPQSTFDLCILGRDPMESAVDEIAANEAIDNRPVRVIRIADASQARTCEILFIAATENAQLRENLAILAGSDVLTVSDVPDFLERGGMIQFVLENNRVRFAVNLDAVNRTHLVLSSELLRVASFVKGKPSPEVQP
jgi:hypothetical protein